MGYRRSFTDEEPRERRRRPVWEAMTAISALLAVGVTAWSIRYTGTSLDLLRQQQNATRFASAVQQLGSDGNENLGLRLGAIYALKSLMTDAPDYGPVTVDVLSAYIRGHATRPAKLPDAVARDPDNDPASPIDVRSAVTVVGAPRPQGAAVLDFSNTLLGLEGINLAGADLHGTYFVHADLRKADLNKANLRDAQLDEASMGYADLRHADLTGADLGGAYLGFAHLEGADLTNAQPSRQPTNQWDCVFVDATTKLPSGVTAPVLAPDENNKCE